MNIIENKKIAIVGGGPGGLTLARLLQLKGADVTVYERDASRNARPQGATLDLHEESGLMALAAAGLLDEFKANYRPGAERLRILDKRAVVLLEDTPKTHEEISRPEIDRGPLQNILLDSLKPGSVVWDCHVLALTAYQEGWKLDFQNGLSVEADIVIAADGANSKIRQYITPIKPFYYGITVIEGTVYNAKTGSPEIYKLLNGGKLFAFDDEKTLIVSSKGDGGLVFYTGFKTDEQWSRLCGIDFSNRVEVLAWFKKEYAGWDNIYHELFDNAVLPFVCRPQYCMPLDQIWKALPNLTILGDAAHLMPPFAGEGVNMAMLDALELSRCLTDGSFADTQMAIAAYEEQMRKRASEAAKDSLHSAEIMHSPEAIPFITGIIN